MAKKKYEKLTSPIGIANYPYLNTPDTKFKEEGEYKVDLTLDAVEDAQFLGQIKARSEKAFEDAKVELTEKGKHAQVKKLQVYYPFEPMYDSEGNETGKIKFKVKTKAKIVRKDGTSFELTPELYDASGAAIDRTEVMIFSGSELRVNFTPAPFYSPAIDKAGVSLRLNAVQVIELSDGNSGSADEFGFGKVDDGFTVADSDFANSSSSANESNEDAPASTNPVFSGSDF